MLIDLLRRPVVAAALAAGVLAAGGVAGPGVAVAGPLTGSSVSASFVSGAAFWNILPTAAQAIPTGYGLGLSGFLTLAMSIDEDGTVSLTPHPSSCSAGCGYGMSGATFDFTLSPGSPALAGVTVIDAAPGTAVTMSFVDADTFRISVGDGGGTTNVNVFRASLDIAETVPEPAGMAVLGGALAMLGVSRRRRS